MSKRRCLLFKKPCSTLWAPSSTREEVCCKADSQLVKGTRLSTRLLSFMPPGGKKKLCHSPAIFVLNFLASGPVTDTISLSACSFWLRNQNPLSLSPSWLQKPAQSQPWIISPTNNSRRLPAWLPMEITGGEGDGKAQSQGTYLFSKVLMWGSSIVKPQRKIEMERRKCIPVCLLSTPLLAVLRTSFQVF